MQERKSKYVNGAKQKQWNATYHGKTVTVWAVTVTGARSQARRFLDAPLGVKLAASPVK